MEEKFKHEISVVGQISFKATDAVYAILVLFVRGTFEQRIVSDLGHPSRIHK